MTNFVLLSDLPWYTQKIKNAIYVTRGDNNSAAAHLHNIKKVINLRNSTDATSAGRGGHIELIRFYTYMYSWYALKPA